ncbi:MAG: hypothetical protein LBE12_15775 [Planctomycetaceae bacterium]|jgi:hypothetical protein|nr:hypothetical protein [Planctomycetaceae bacterium]
MDKQILNHLLIESLEYTALRDREFFVQETIERVNAGKHKEIQQTNGEQNKNQTNPVSS